MMNSHTLFSGATMPSIGLGTWQSDPGVVGAAVKDALALGYRHIDCAAIYANEAEIGAAFDDVLGGDVRREDVFVTSKLWNTMHAAADVATALQKTLADLRLGYLDLYLVHWPVVQDGDGALRPLEGIPVAETWQALEACVDAGLVKDIGVSNFSVAKLKRLLTTARIKPSVNQVERHPYLQNPELIQFCQQEGILLTAYSPLGTPATSLANKDEPPILENSVVKEIAEKHGATPAQVLIAWALSCGTTVIPKSSQKRRIAENLEAQTLTLDDDDLSRIKGLDKHHRYVDGSFWCGDKSPYSLENLWDEAHLGGGDEL